MSAPPTLLCIANFPANTGYAWDYIEGTYARLADRLVREGIRTQVGYPRIDAPPRPLASSAAQPLTLALTLDAPGALLRFAAHCRRENVRALYLADRPVAHPAYAALRASGVRRIVVHDHSAGPTAVPTGVVRVLKRARARLCGADAVIGVSRFVVRRLGESDLVPPERLTCVYNFVEVPRIDRAERARARRALGIPDDRPVILCLARATPQKGVHHLLRAFDRAALPEAALFHCGDGPQLAELRALRDTLPSRARIHLRGHRPHAAELFAGAEVCVVPSVWREAFGLTVAEAMARGRAVVASAVGAIPELVVHGESGLLVPPGDEVALAGALTRLVRDGAEAARLGTAARERVRTLLAPEATLNALHARLTPAFIDDPPGKPLAWADLSDRAPG